jgi:glycerate 2-kinase
LNELRQDAFTILRAALDAADAGEAVRRHLVLPDGEFDRISLLAVGKAALAMARAVEEKIPDLHSVLLITKHGHASEAPSHWQVIEAGHPVPDIHSSRAGDAVQTLVTGLNARDLLIVAVSGGSSALLSAPLKPLQLEEKQQTTEQLLRAGATINELNAVRKHISDLKGGRLIQLARPATVLGLLLSDVIGDPIDVIGSGLTAPDSSTYADALGIVRRYKLEEKLPSSTLDVLQRGVDGAIPETPKKDDPIFQHVHNIVVGSNALALDAAAARARELGYQVSVLSSAIEGEARELARGHVELLKDKLQASDARSGESICILSGGEPTVTVTGAGKGGRNQEFALSAAIAMEGFAEGLVLSAGTDGTDGPTDAAGALATGDTVSRARALGLEPEVSLEHNDSYQFFDALGDLVKTGPTGTNVMDIHIMLARRN